MTENSNLEEIVMKLIGKSGASRSLAFEALNEAKNGNFEKSAEFMNRARTLLLDAHEIQCDLIFQEANDNKINLTLLMVHAQDHLMSSILAKDLISELIEIYKVNKEELLCQKN